MSPSFLTPSHSSKDEPDVYADKSALVLQWLLLHGVERPSLSLREVALESLVSVGLVQRIFDHLVRHGILSVSGVRTAKQFHLKKPSALLAAWTEHYSLTKKCRMWTYQSALGSREEIIDALKRSKISAHTRLALHSAASELGVRNTNLQTVELYVMDPETRLPLEKLLELHPKERGYEVLLIKPYYKAMLRSEEPGKVPKRGLGFSPTLLTYLDLFHFPLRGREQAEFMAQRIPELKRIMRGS